MSFPVPTAGIESSRDEDTEYVVTVSASEETIEEGDTASFTFTREGSGTGTLSVKFSVTASRGTVFAFRLGTKTVSFAENETTVSYDVVTNDTVHYEGGTSAAEPSQFVKVKLLAGGSAPFNYDIGETGEETIGVTDNEELVEYSLVVPEAGIALSEGVGRASLFVRATTKTAGSPTDNRYQIAVVSEGAGATATSGRDYVPVSEVVVFTGTSAWAAITVDGQSRYTAVSGFTIEIREDAVVEATEMFRLEIQGLPGRDDPTTDVGMVGVRIIDNDTAAVTVSPTTLTVTEGSTATYSVKLTSAPTAEVTVSVSVPSNTDVSVNRTSLMFTAGDWDTAQAVTVTAAEDDDATADSAVTLTHSASGGEYGSVPVDSVVVTIRENETAGVAVSPTTLAVTEGSTGTYAVRLSSQPTANVTVSVSVPSNTDVSVDRTSLTFTSTTWETAQTVTVTAAEDDDAVTDSPVTISHGVSGGDYGSVAADGVVVRIGENETAGVTVAPSALRLPEGLTGAYTVVLTSEPTADVTVSVSVPSNTDVSVDETSLTFTSTTWATAQTVTVTAGEDDDAVPEPLVRIGHGVSGGDYGSVSVDGVEVTITENERTRVMVSPTMLTVTEGAKGSYAVALASQPTADVTVSVSVPLNTDVSVDKTSLTFTSTTWATAQTVTVTAAEDDDAEADSTVTLSHSASGGNYASVPVDSVVVTVHRVQGSGGGPAMLGASPGRVRENQGAVSIEVSAALSATGSRVVTVTVEVEAGTAAEGTDFESVEPFDIVIPAGSLSGIASFTLVSLDDGLVEADETVLLSGTSDRSGLTVTGTQVTIEDDDVAPVATGSVSIVGTPRVGATLTAVPSNVTDPDGVGPFSFVWSADGAAIDGAAADTFVPTETEIGKYLVVSLSYTAGSGEEKTLVSSPFGPIGEPAPVAPPPPPPTPPTLTLASGPSRVAEGSSVRFTVTRSQADTELPPIEVSIAETGSVLASVSPGRILFAAGETTALLRLETVDDNVDEPDSDVTAALAANSEYELGSQSVATVTVADNDAAPLLTIEAMVTMEGAGTVDLVARLSRGSSRPLSVKWSTRDGLAVAGRDFVEASGTLTFAPGSVEERFSVDLMDDDMAEDLEDFMIVLGDADMPMDRPSVPVKIIDDDALPVEVALSFDREVISEGAGPTALSVTASLVGGTWDRETAVAVEVGGTGVADAVDFAPVPGFEIRIPAGESSGSASFTLIPEDDRVDELDETIEVSGASVLPVSPASLVLEDDDESSGSIVLAVTPETVSEAAGSTVVTLTATLDRSVRPRDTAVQVAVSGSGSSEAVDYQAVKSLELTIPEGEFAGAVSFTLVPENDQVDELDETIEISGRSVLPVSPASLILEDDDESSESIMLTVTPQLVSEAGGPTTVTAMASLDRSARTRSTPVRVEVSGSGLSGVVGFVPVPAFILTIPAEQASGLETFVLTPVNDMEEAYPETVEVRGEADLPVTGASLQLTDDDDASAARGWLSRFARTVASQTVEMVEERLEGRSTAADHLTIAGYRILGDRGSRRPAGASMPPVSGWSGGSQPGVPLRAGPPPVAAPPSGASWLNGQGPFGASGFVAVPTLLGGRVGGGGGSLGSSLSGSSSLGRPARWGDRGQSFSLSRFREDQRWDLLARSSFSLSSLADRDGSGKAGEAGNWTAWGRGAMTNFRGIEGDLSLRGDVATGTVGVDYERGRFLTGLAVGLSRGEGDFGSGPAVEATLTSSHPYMRMQVNENLALWGLLGYGRGKFSMIEHGAATETDISLAMGAVGLRRDLVSSARGFGLGLKSDVLLVRIDSDPVPGLAAVSEDVSRVRLALEASYDQPFAAGGVLTPSLEVGVRYDGGDADRGRGVEMGAGLRYADFERGLTIEFTGRSLLTHQVNGFEEWGGSGSVALDPGESGRGVSLGLRSSWGSSHGGIQQFWSRQQMFDREEGFSLRQGGRVEAEAGYGLGRAAGRYLVSPYGVLMFAEEGERGFGAGARFDFARTFSLSLEVSRRRFAGAESEGAVVLRGTLRRGPRVEPERPVRAGPEKARSAALPATP